MFDFVFLLFCFIGIFLSILSLTEASRTRTKLTSTVARTDKSTAHIVFVQCVLNCYNQRYILFLYFCSINRSKTHATIRAWGGEERKIEIFPSVENDQDNNLKCHALVSDMKICTKSLLSGTEGEFTGHASFFFTPKVLLVRVVPGMHPCMYTHFFMFFRLIVWISSSNSAFYQDMFNVLVPCLARRHS